MFRLGIATNEHVVRMIDDAFRLMKIVAGHWREVVEWPETLSLDRTVAAVVLENPFNDQS